MSGFSAQWLSLREPYDLRARNADVLDAVSGAFQAQTSIAVVDLACGTGATLRAIGKRLPKRQNWRLVDNDLGLLAQAAALARPPEVTVVARTVDLARDLEIALDGPGELVTTSALLDLVSAEWLERLTVEAAARRLPVYAALTYCGSAELDPPEPFDRDILAAVNRHQRRNKGFGPALGPAAAARSVQAFEQVGYQVRSGPSDWVFGPADCAIQCQVLAGWAEAAIELAELPAPSITAWLGRRRELAITSRASMRVGHLDLFAVPTTTR
jgi:hypothetical protein